MIGSENSEVFTNSYLLQQVEHGRAEMRRSGYPKMYPLIHSENPDVPADKMIRHIPFLDFNKSTNGPAVEEARALLNGPDNAATPLWWDVH